MQLWRPRFGGCPNFPVHTIGTESNQLTLIQLLLKAHKT